MVSKEIPVFSFEVQSCIRGYHIYKAVWTPYIGETLPCFRELTNGHDPFSVKVSQLEGEDEMIVGHLPRKISSICSIFLEKRWEYFCHSLWEQEIFSRFSARRIGDSVSAETRNHR